MASEDLTHRIGLSENSLSRIKTGNIKAIRWSTLEAICRELECQPGDLLEYVPKSEIVATQENVAGLPRRPLRELYAQQRPLRNNKRMIRSYHQRSG